MLTKTTTRTKAERFNEWKELAFHSTNHAWQIDTIHNGRNGQDLIMHKGTTSGYFISVDREGMVRVGGYRNAEPHISDGEFLTAVEYKCKDFKDGVTRILNKIGLSAIIYLFR